MCSSRKREYHSHDAAMRHARKQIDGKRTVLRVYHCTECKQWHLTKVPHQLNLKAQRYWNQRHEESW